MSASPLLEYITQTEPGFSAIMLWVQGLMHEHGTGVVAGIFQHGMLL